MNLRVLQTLVFICACCIALSAPMSFVVLPRVFNICLSLLVAFLLILPSIPIFVVPTVLSNVSFFCINQIAYGMV